MTRSQLKQCYSVIVILSYYWVGENNHQLPGYSAGDLFGMVFCDLLERLLVTSNDRVSKGHDLNHLVDNGLMGSVSHIFFTSPQFFGEMIQI